VSSARTRAVIAVFERGPPWPGPACKIRTGRSARFLMLGPTGVRQDRALQGTGRLPVRRRPGDGPASDMSEFMEKPFRLAADRRTAGLCVGYDEGGVLTEAVRRRPYQVVLFDEGREGRTPMSSTCSLQVLDGRSSDRRPRSHGRLQETRLIIMTSNLGQRVSRRPEGRRRFQARCVIR